ncbi:PR domain zinc finger protein 5-like isoform X10 [Maniola hyperantus]|uniref:PR domain zinc finger protein 5-like isoform X10 n=1 Tax=Aphantopus hyperantus TaxID=2795564 RepID=UPI0037495E50
MEGVLSDGMCRCCATEGSFKDFQVAYQWMGVEEIYGNMLKDCFDITLSVSEEISNGGICEVCITQLRNACNFKQQVQRTEEKFQKKLQEASFKTEGIKMEISRFEDDDSNISADDFSSPEYEVPIKVEKVEEKPKKRAAAKASTSKAKKTKASEGEPSVKRNRQLIVKSEITDVTTKSNVNEEVKKIVVSKKAKSAKVKTPTINIVMDRGQFKTIKRSRPTTLSEKDKHAHNFEVVLGNSTATPLLSRDGFTYTCCFCTEHYVYPAELKSHTLLKHDNSHDRREFMKKQSSSGYVLKLDITLLKCKMCDVNIDTVEGLLDHLQNEHKKLIYRDVKNQIIPLKFEGEDLRCAICHLVFNKYKILVEHMKTHYRNYVCEVCDYGCINRRAMINHKQSHKTGSFECNKCSKVFRTDQKRKQHFYTVHKFMSMPNKCGICNERFKRSPLKDQHMVAVHGMSPIIRKCLSCDKTFTTQVALRIHTKKYHLMERNFPCTECEMKFFSKERLKFHMLKHTGRKDFQCDVCLKWYTKKWILKEHMRIHMNDRRFTCLQCGRGFVQKCSWRGHMRSVHGKIEC